NDELRAEIQSVYDYIDRSFTSVADGKQLVASALATKNKTVADDATFREIYDAILDIPQTVQAGSLTGDVVITYHHHTLGVCGDADSTDGTPGEYLDTYRSSVNSGCFMTPVYHVHTNDCYHTAYHEGVFEWDGFASDVDENGNEVGDWSSGGWVQCKYCNADTYHVERGHGSQSAGSRTISWRTQELICGKTAGSLEYYKKSCPLTEGQPVQSVVTYYSY
ncbi:MAG: hypothetical protein IJ589_08375, partial [Lachnospiraceae bacterium]|nr:hypothetical protein [Lachnospiraceae bacterium]